MINIRNLEFTLSALINPERGAERVQMLRAILSELIDSESYRGWFDAHEKYTSIDPRSRFILDETLRKRRIISKFDYAALEYFHLINGPFLEAKIHRLDSKLGGRATSRSSIVLTDGHWGSVSNRVYSYSDESEILAEYVCSQELDVWADLVVDPACGCGHHRLHLPGCDPFFSSDINYRAVLFSKINAVLNGLEPSTIFQHDITTGVSPFVTNFRNERNILFLVNMPFVYIPRHPGNRGSEIAPKLFQDGGFYGVTLTKSALESIATLRGSRPDLNITAVVLFYSPGHLEENRWDIIEFIESKLNPVSFSYEIFSDRLMWRVNGAKSSMSPMPVQLMNSKADCVHTYYTRALRQTMRENYERATADLLSKKITHLAYGIAKIDL